MRVIYSIGAKFAGGGIGTTDSITTARLISWRPLRERVNNI